MQADRIIYTIGVSLLLLLLIFLMFKKYIFPDIDKLMIDKFEQGIKIYELKDIIGDDLFKYDLIVLKKENELRERMISIKNNQVVRVFYTKLTSDGGYAHNQVFLESSKNLEFYCGKHAKVQLIEADYDSSLFLLNPLGVGQRKYLNRSIALLYGFDVDTTVGSARVADINKLISKVCL
ncbi:hypothetical protein [Moraxella marmotae]|uniref:hypothetical protein n=1 Tax=Moraxella marmotae TaxID=3344520 RepID=UPI0035F4B84C